MSGDILDKGEGPSVWYEVQTELDAARMFSDAEEGGNYVGNAIIVAHA